MKPTPRKTRDQRVTRSHGAVGLHKELVNLPKSPQKTPKKVKSRLETKFNFGSDNTMDGSEKNTRKTRSLAGSGGSDSNVEQSDKDPELPSEDNTGSGIKEISQEISDLKEEMVCEVESNEKVASEKEASETKLPVLRSSRRISTSKDVMEIKTRPTRRTRSAALVPVKESESQSESSAAKITSAAEKMDEKLQSAKKTGKRNARLPDEANNPKELPENLEKAEEKPPEMEGGSLGVTGMVAEEKLALKSKNSAPENEEKIILKESDKKSTNEEEIIRFISSCRQLMQKTPEKTDSKDPAADSSAVAPSAEVVDESRDLVLQLDDSLEKIETFKKSKAKETKKKPDLHMELKTPGENYIFDTPVSSPDEALSGQKAESKPLEKPMEISDEEKKVLRKTPRKQGKDFSNVKKGLVSSDKEILENFENKSPKLVISSVMEFKESLRTPKSAKKSKSLEISEVEEIKPSKSPKSAKKSESLEISEVEEIKSSQTPKSTKKSESLKISEVEEIELSKTPKSAKKSKSLEISEVEEIELSKTPKSTKKSESLKISEVEEIELSKTPKSAKKSKSLEISEVEEIELSKTPKSTKKSESLKISEVEEIELSKTPKSAKKSKSLEISEVEEIELSKTPKSTKKSESLKISEVEEIELSKTPKSAKKSKSLEISEVEEIELSKTPKSAKKSESLKISEVEEIELSKTPKSAKKSKSLETSEVEEIKPLKTPKSVKKSESLEISKVEEINPSKTPTKSLDSSDVSKCLKTPELAEKKKSSNKTPLKSISDINKAEISNVKEKQELKPVKTPCKMKEISSGEKTDLKNQSLIKDFLIKEKDLETGSTQPRKSPKSAKKRQNLETSEAENKCSPNSKSVKKSLDEEIKKTETLEESVGGEEKSVAVQPELGSAEKPLVLEPEVAESSETVELTKMETLESSKVTEVSEVTKEGIEKEILESEVQETKESNETNVPEIEELEIVETKPPKSAKKKNRKNIIDETSKEENLEFLKITDSAEKIETFDDKEESSKSQKTSKSKKTKIQESSEEDQSVKTEVTMPSDTPKSVPKMVSEECSKKENFGLTESAENEKKIPKLQETKSTEILKEEIKSLEMAESVELIELAEDSSQEKLSKKSKKQKRKLSPDVEDSAKESVVNTAPEIIMVNQESKPKKSKKSKKVKSLNSEELKNQDEESTQIPESTNDVEKILSREPRRRSKKDSSKIFNTLPFEEFEELGMEPSGEKDTVELVNDAVVVVNMSPEGGDLEKTLDLESGLNNQSWNQASFGFTKIKPSIQDVSSTQMFHDATLTQRVKEIVFPLLKQNQNQEMTTCDSNVPFAPISKNILKKEKKKKEKKSSCSDTNEEISSQKSPIEFNPSKSSFSTTIDESIVISDDSENECPNLELVNLMTKMDEIVKNSEVKTKSKKKSKKKEALTELNTETEEVTETKNSKKKTKKKKNEGILSNFDVPPKEEELVIDSENSQSLKKKSKSIKETVNNNQENPKQKSKRKLDSNSEKTPKAKKLKLEINDNKVKTPGFVMSNSIPNNIDEIDIQNLLLQKKIKLLSMRQKNGQTELCIDDADQIGGAVFLLSKAFLGASVRIDRYFPKKEVELETDEDGFKLSQVHISHIPSYVTEEDLISLFPKAIRCDLPKKRNKPHINLGHCFLTFPSVKIAMEHLQLNDKVNLAGNKLQITSMSKKSSSNQGICGNLLKKLLVDVTDLDCVLVVENLPPKIEEFNLETVFPSVVSVYMKSEKAIVICKDANQAANFVSKKLFWNEHKLDVKRATQDLLESATKKPMDLTQEIPKGYLNSTIIVTHLPEKTKKKDITKLFPNCIFSKLQAKKKYAVVSFPSQTEMLKVFQNPNLKICDQQIRIKQLKQHSNTSKKDLNKLLHVRGFPKSTTLTQLKSVFKHCKITITQTNGVRYAIVKCPSEEKAQTLHDKKSLIVGGKNIKIQFVKNIFKQMRKNLD